MKHFTKWLFILFFLQISNTILSQINFHPYETFPLESWASITSISDVNNDGLHDVVLATAFYFDSINDYKIFVFLQNLQGGLEDPVRYSYPEIYPGLKTMTVADVNNDNRNDVIVGYYNSMGIFYQNETGTLDTMIPYLLDPTVHRIHTADLNNDSLTDIAVAVSHWNQPYIKIFYQTPSGFNTLSYPKPLSSDDEMGLGDVNNDGLMDIVYSDGRIEGGIHIYHQNTSGTLDNYITYYPEPAGLHTLNDIDVGDLNNDDAADIVVTRGGNTPDSKIILWFQDTENDSLEVPIEIPAYHSSTPVEIADLNCDGANEIIVGHSSWDAVTVYEQDSMFQYNEYKRFDAATNGLDLQGLSIGDINNDGRIDIAIADFSVGLVLLLNNSIPTEFDDIDTAETIDNFYKDTVYENSIWVEVSTDTINEFVFIRTDSFSIIKFFRQDSFQTDSVFIRNAVFCSRPYVDTLINTFYSFLSTLVSCDTIFISTHIDSFLVGSEHTSFPNTDLRIYPNPTEGIINIEIPESLGNQNIQIEVYNDAGRIVFKDNFKSARNVRQLDFKTYPDGIYIVVLSINETRISQKIMKTKK